MDSDSLGEEMPTTGSSPFGETRTVTADSPLLRGHLVRGRTLLPGVGCVDLVLQVLARHGHAMPDVELRNLTIERELVHSGLLKVDGVVHHGAAGSVVALELPPAHPSCAADSLFHPALFEAGLLGGGVGIHVLHEGHQGDELHLPLVFESFRAIAPLGRNCFVRVPAASALRDDELFGLAVEFYDETGAPIAEIGQLVAERVRAVESLDVRGGSAPAGAAAAPVADPMGAGTGQATAGRDAMSVLRELTAVRLELSASHVDVHGSFYQLVLTSAQLDSLVVELANRLGLSLSPTIVFEHRSITELADWLRERVTERHGAGRTHRRLRADPCGRASAPRSGQRGAAPCRGVQGRPAESLLRDLLVGRGGVRQHRPERPRLRQRLPRPLRGPPGGTATPGPAARTHPGRCLAGSG